ncbi:uncharacterized protein PRCAT00001783001 [Priceomyces carsonii]|uniref:uncharacterized protein n=1 Tax=Priceomyces carsonii TaxID=28549 RepID=UPI002EDA0F74|nr:unnamed protein product [Priceomyces carsonii]
MKTQVFVILVSIAVFYFTQKFSSKSYSVKYHDMSVAKFVKNPNPFPTFFLSHGGPTFMYEDDEFGNKGAWNITRTLGQTIKNKWKPDYIIVVSAHWQSSGRNSVEIAVPSDGEDQNALIYDFYGFPDYMYKEKFRTKCSKFLANDVKEHLKAGGFHTTLSKRGIDHGVWVPLKVAFSEDSSVKEPEAINKLDLPDTSLIQVSLTYTDDFETNFRLGELLSNYTNNLLWDEKRGKYLKGLIICSGMSVHNLRDLGIAFLKPGHVMPYVRPFNSILTETLYNSPNVLAGLQELRRKHNSLMFQAHPTLEHFLPIVVASGIHNECGGSIKELYTDSQASLGWNIYQFGDDYICETRKL